MSKTLKNEIQAVVANLPKNSDIYIFGSFLNNAHPNDMDILIVYDDNLCSPKLAYREFHSIIRQLEQLFSLKVDVTLLTRDEENSVNFIKSENCLKIDDIFV